jgi:hypothetical protein
VTVHTILGHKDTKNGVKLLSEIWGTLNNILEVAGETARLLGGVAYRAAHGVSGAKTIFPKSFHMPFI